VCDKNTKISPKYFSFSFFSDSLSFISFRSPKYQEPFQRMKIRITIISKIISLRNHFGRRRNLVAKTSTTYFTQVLIFKFFLQTISGADWIWSPKHQLITLTIFFFVTDQHLYDRTKIPKQWTVTIGDKIIVAVSQMIFFRSDLLSRADFVVYKKNWTKSHIFQGVKISIPISTFSLQTISGAITQYFCR
jgi:hypothetical protein